MQKQIAASNFYQAPKKKEILKCKAIFDTTAVSYEE